jgi:hypothetical protein
VGSLAELGKTTNTPQQRWELAENTNVAKLTADDLRRNHGHHHLGGEMFTKRDVKIAISSALALILLGSLHGCMQDIAVPQVDDGDLPPNCVWVGDTIVCKDS